MLRWVSISALWDTCSGYHYHYSVKPHRLFLSCTNSTLLHVRPVKAAASRVSSSRLKFIINEVVDVHHQLACWCILEQFDVTASVKTCPTRVLLRREPLTHLRFVLSTDNKFFYPIFLFLWQEQTEDVVVFLFLTFSVSVANPKKPTLYGHQSRSWSAEQGKKNKRKRSGTPHPPKLVFRKNK